MYSAALRSASVYIMPEKPFFGRFMQSFEDSEDIDVSSFCPISPYLVMGVHGTLGVERGFIRG